MLWSCVGQNASASPVGTADWFNLLSEDGKRLVIRRGEDPEILAINELEGRFQASIAIVDDQIYICCADHLNCVEK